MPWPRDERLEKTGERIMEETAKIIERFTESVHRFYDEKNMNRHLTSQKSDVSPA